MSYEDQSEASKALDQREHNKDAGAKRVVIRGQNPDDGEFYNISAVENIDGSFSLSTTATLDASGLSGRWTGYEDAGQDLAGDPMYFAKEHANGDWVIKQFGITSGRTKYYEGTGGLASNWAGRAGYTYVEYKDL